MSITESDIDILQRISAQVSQNAAPDINKVVAEAPKPAKTWGFAGFGPKSRILTSFGHVPLEALRRRDPVKTFDGRFLEVQHVDEIRLDRRYLIDHPEAQPILMPKGSLGPSAPNTHMYVSGAQRLRKTDRFDQDAGATAEEMIGRAGIMRKSHGYFSYFNFHCGERCLVSIDGVWCEVGPNNQAESLH